MHDLRARYFIIHIHSCTNVALYVLLHPCPLSLFSTLITSIHLSTRYNNMDDTSTKFSTQTTGNAISPRLSGRREVSPVSPLDTSSQTIKELKHKHLQELKKVLPKDFHSFYDGVDHERCQSTAGITHAHTHQCVMATGVSLLSPCVSHGSPFLVCPVCPQFSSLCVCVHVSSLCLPAHLNHTAANNLLISCQLIYPGFPSTHRQIVVPVFVVPTLRPSYLYF